ARVPDGRNRRTFEKVLQFGRSSPGEYPREGPHKLTRFPAFSVVRSRPRAQRQVPNRRAARSRSARRHARRLGCRCGPSRRRCAPRRARVSSLEAQIEQLRGEQATLTLQLTATQRTLAVSQQRLEQNLSLLYKQGDVNTVAVVLGATSLNDALTRLDDLD